MYQIPDALANIDNNLAWVMFLSISGWILGFVQMFEGLRLTWRDKVIGLPLSYMIIVIAHDSYFALHYQFMFQQVNHWYFNFTTYMFFLPPPIEILGLILLVTTARKELLPEFPVWAYYGIYALFQITAIVLYWLFKSWVDDPLHLIGITIAQYINILWMIPMILRRKNTRGQSRLMAWTLLLSPGSTTIFLATAIVPSLLTPVYLAAAGCMTALSIVYILLYEYYRRQESLSSANKGVNMNNTLLERTI
jgi:hypothetical protein